MMIFFLNKWESGPDKNGLTQDFHPVFTPTPHPQKTIIDSFTTSINIKYFVAATMFTSTLLKSYPRSVAESD